jgi:hypothetical protein
MRLCPISRWELLRLPYSVTRQIQQLVKILSRRKREGDAVCYPIPGEGLPLKKNLLLCLGLCWPWADLCPRCILRALAVRTRFVIRRRRKHLESM